MADYGLEGKLKKAFDFLAVINQVAYENIYLLSNEVLSKNAFSNNFFEKFLKDETPHLPDKFAVLVKLLQYYFRNIVYFGIYLLFLLAFYVSRLKFVTNPSHKELILIDTFVLIDELEKNKTYEDPYFIGLKEVLEKLGKHYAYLPVFCVTKNPLKLFKIFKLLKKNRVPILAEYQLLSGKDFLKIFYFILVYPMHVLAFVSIINEGGYEAQLLKSELIDNLTNIIFFKFSRYLQGKKISKLTYENIKLISWFENQAIDKNLYKGIREGGNKIKIYGAQPFLAPKVMLNTLVDENEVRFGIVPDKIVVNGSYFIPKSTTLNFTAGPSFRYKKIFTTVLDEKNRKNLLILLPYYTEDARNILNLLNKIDISAQNIIIKAHPSTPMERFKSFIPPKALVVSGDLYEMFKTTKVAIGAASGTLVEAVSLGIPVVSVKNVQRLDYNSLLLYGKGIIWEEVTNYAELEKTLAKFESALKNTNELNKIKRIAAQYKDMFFCPPTDDNIIRAYELGC